MTEIAKRAPNHRGLGKTLKRIMPPSAFSALRIIFNKSLTVVPTGLKYAIATQLRKNKYPYCLIRDGDIVVQIGAPKDILLAGRSRAMNFLRLVGTGKVIVVEPDQINYDALKHESVKGKMADRLLLSQQGAWSEPGTLQFLSNPDHPATNVLKVVQKPGGTDDTDAGYRTIEVPVDTLDSILQCAGVDVPRLISITANGAERHILMGMKRTIASGVPYISLAATGSGYEALMSELQYDLMAFDDRGYTFARRTPESGDLGSNTVGRGSAV